MPTGEFLYDFMPALVHWLKYLIRFAVATVMFSTTTLIAVQMVYVKHWPIIIAVAFFLFYGFIDGALHQTSSRLRFSWVPRRVLGSIVEEGPGCTLYCLRQVLIG